MFERLRAMPLGEKLAAGFALLTAGAAVVLTTRDGQTGSAQIARDQLGAAASLGRPMGPRSAPPPNLREQTAGVAARCDTCAFYRKPSGKRSICSRYRWIVKPNWVCDSQRA